MAEEMPDIPPLEGSTLATARTQYHEARTNAEKEEVLMRFPALGGFYRTARYAELKASAAAKAAEADKPKDNPT